MAISEVVAFVWVPDITPLVISKVGAAEVATVVDSDVMAEHWRPECRNGGLGFSGVVMGRPGSEYHHPGVLACYLEAGKGLVMAVVNNVVSLGLGGSGCEGGGWG